MTLLRDITAGGLVSRVVAMLAFSAVLGLLMAAFARLLGDRRPEYQERLTANPFAHVSVSGVLVAAVFGLGWIRSMRFDAAANRWGRVGVLLVCLAALLLTSLTIPLVDVLRAIAVSTLPRTAGYAVIYGLQQYQQVALASCLLNLLPLPGLACGAIWPAIYPEREKRITRLEPILLSLVAAMIVAGVVPDLSRDLMPYFSALRS